MELRHSSSIGSRASSSPMKRDDVSSPLSPDNHPSYDDDHDRHSSKDRDRHFWYHLPSICPFFNDDARFSPHNSRIWLLFVLFLALAGFVSVSSIVNRLVSILIARCSAFCKSNSYRRAFSVFLLCVFRLLRKCGNQRRMELWNAS